MATLRPHTTAKSNGRDSSSSGVAGSADTGSGGRRGTPEPTPGSAFGQRQRDPSPMAEALIPEQVVSKPAQLSPVYKWIVVLVVTVCTVYFFEARQFDFLTWLFSFRALIYSCAVLVMTGSLAFPPLRPAVFLMLMSYSGLLIWITITMPSLPTLREALSIAETNPINETAYDTGCELYDSSHSQPFHNIIEKMDMFVWLHVIGYVCKFLFLRSWWMCHAMSISFELAEYSLQHHLPNFKECWWDHWICDALISNTFGMWVGCKIVEYCQLERYQWRSLVVPTVRRQGKIKLFRSKLLRLRNMALIAFVVVIVMIGELNTFYIKFLLWLPSEHWFNCLRVLVGVSSAIPAANEFYSVLQGRKPRLVPFLFCVGLFIMQFAEMITYMRLGYESFAVPFPQHIILLWTGIILVCCAYAIWRLLLRKCLLGPEEDEEEGERHFERIQRQRLKRT